MNRFALTSNIYNQNDIIKSASELGTSLFRRFNNLFIFKNLIAGHNITLNETDNFITINSSPSTAQKYMVFSLKGITDDKPFFKIKSDNDIFMNVIGNIGDCDISFKTRNNNFIGVHTHDQNLDINSSDKIYVNCSEIGKEFELYINAFSQTDIILESDHSINYLR